MAILTKPTISKGQANEFDLSKSDLAAVSKVVNDSYFSDQANWSKVIVEYKSAEGNQHEMIIFDASEASPKANFEVSKKARDSWEVQSVKIMDFDGGYLKLGRGDLTVADFDIALGSVGGDVGGSGLTFSSIYEPSLTLSNNNLTITQDTAQTPNQAWGLVSPSIDNTAGGKYFFEMTVDTNNNQIAVGGVHIDDANPSVFDSYSGVSPLAPFSIESGYVEFFVNSGSGLVFINGAAQGSFGSALSNGDVLTWAIDLDNDKIFVALNGVWEGGDDPATNTGGTVVTALSTKALTYFGASFGNGGSLNSQVTIAATPTVITSLTGFTYIGS